MKLYLDGCEEQRIADLVLSTPGVKYVAISFFAIYRSYDEEFRADFIQAFLDRGIRLGLNSGYFSINKDLWFEYNPENGLLEWDEKDLPASILNKWKGKGKDLNDLKEEDYRIIKRYEKCYLDFVSKYGSNFDYIQELYIPKLGPLFKRKHRESLSNFPNLKFMAIHHELSDSVIEDLGASYISSVGVRDVDNTKLTRFIHDRSNGIVANKYLIHGLGAGSPGTLNPVDYYSADTSTWLSGSRYATIYHYKGGLNLEIYTDLRKCDNLAGIRTEAIKSGIDPDDLINLNKHVLDEWNLHQYIKYVNDLEYLKVSREYWISDEDKNRLIDEYRTLKGTDIVLSNKPTVSIETYSDIPRSMMRFCNTCVLNTTCPEYKPGETCAYTKQYDNLTLKTQDSVLDASAALAQMMFQRATHAYQSELMNGGIPTKETTELLNNAMKALSDITQMRLKASTASINISATGPGVSVIGALLNRANGVASNKDPSGRTINMDRNKPSKQRDISDAEIIDHE